MAKPREVLGLHCDEPFASVGARVVNVRADELLEHSEGVLDTADIERLHDMRVASRRLRAAMEVFEPCFPRKRFRTALREVKAIADALGQRRDRDVSIEALGGFGAALEPGDARGVELLVEGLRGEQRVANERLVQFVDRRRLSDLRELIRELTADCGPAGGVKARRVKKLDPAAPLVENAARIVRSRAEELRSFAEQALAPEATRAQHDMRIAAKRLRYVIEVTGFCFGKPAQEARRSARELQDLLGEIRDCDVMLPRVESELERLRAEDSRAVLLRAAEARDLDAGLVAAAPNRAAYRGLELLAVHLRARRALLFERFRDFWQAQASKGTWAKLERAIEEALAKPDKPRSLRPADQPPATLRAPSHSAG